MTLSTKITFRKPSHSLLAKGPVQLVGDSAYFSYANLLGNYLLSSFPLPNRLRHAERQDGAAHERRVACVPEKKGPAPRRGSRAYGKSQEEELLQDAQGVVGHPGGVGLGINRRDRSSRSRMGRCGGYGGPG